MRKLVLILFLAMLPLQWTAAAVAALCLPDARAAGSAHAQVTHLTARAASVDLAHGHALASASVHHDAHDPDASGGKALHAEHGGCCHAAGSALPPWFAMQRLQAVPDDLVARMTVLAVSHFSESPFRPPRIALA